MSDETRPQQRVGVFHTFSSLCEIRYVALLTPTLMWCRSRQMRPLIERMIVQNRLV